MDCPDVRSLLNPYIDREVEAADKARIEEHLRECGGCRKTYNEHASLKTAIGGNATYYEAPGELAARIRASVTAQPPETSAIPPRRDLPRMSPRMSVNWRRWFELGAAVAASVVITSVATLRLASVDADPAISAQIVNAHARATLTNHATDVASSDQHTVKPWLSSKLDFSPPVIDLTTTGFPLRGGRLDYVDGRPVAVLIYTHRQHVIDLYVWPVRAAGDEASRTRTSAKNGFNMV